MTTPRRRILRPVSVDSHGQARPSHVHTWQARLERERESFHRWLTRLRRAVHAVEIA
jgi:hypothetical protein